jgi:hypothetical protein
LSYRLSWDLAKNNLPRFVILYCWSNPKGMLAAKDYHIMQRLVINVPLRSYHEKSVV